LLLCSSLQDFFPLVMMHLWCSSSPPSPPFKNSFARADIMEQQNGTLMYKRQTLSWLIPILCLLSFCRRKNQKRKNSRRSSCYSLPVMCVGREFVEEEIANQWEGRKDLCKD
jgi:hypothetical protein